MPMGRGSFLKVCLGKHSFRSVIQSTGLQETPKYRIVTASPDQFSARSIHSLADLCYHHFLCKAEDQAVGCMHCSGASLSYAFDD